MAAAPVRSFSRPTAPKPPSDPFFDLPYEASGTAEPSWDSKSPASTITPRGLSPNIKPKRKVAALFGVKSTESV